MKKLMSFPNLRAVWALLLLGIAVAATSAQIAYSQPPQRNQTLIDKARCAAAFPPTPRMNIW